MFLTSQSPVVLPDINLFDIIVSVPLRDATGPYLGLYTLVGGSEVGEPTAMPRIL